MKFITNEGKTVIDPRLMGVKKEHLPHLLNLEITGETGSQLYNDTIEQIARIYGQTVIVLSTEMHENIPVGRNGIINLGSDDDETITIYSPITTLRVS